MDNATHNSGRSLFAPLAEAATLYPGKVMHARLKPFGHRFNYRVFTILVDLDKLREADKTAWFFSINRRNLVAFHESDHIEKGCKSSTLRAYVDELLEEAAIERASTIKLLAYPRILNFVFNPISVYFCYGENDELTAAIYEVRNTFGERHTYVCAVQDGQLSAAGLRQERTKIFYVSPFIDMGTRYYFRVVPPGDEVKLRIFETEENEPLLCATFGARRKPFTSANLAVQVARLPFMTINIVAGIHYEALKLWLKGAKFHARGKPPVSVSHEDAGVPASAE